MLVNLKKIKKVCLMYTFVLNIVICANIFAQEAEQEEALVLTLEKGIYLATTAERRLSSMQGALLQSEINIQLASAEFDWNIFPKADAGLVGGGRAGVGATLGMGVEVTKKFCNGTRFTFTPTMMKAAKNYQSNLQTSITQPLLRGFGSAYTLAPLRAAQFSNRSAIRQFYIAQSKQIFVAIKGMYEILRQEKLVELDKESVDRMGKFVFSTKMKERIGMSDALDIYRAETEFKLTEDSLSRSSEQLQDAKDVLRDILGLSIEMPITVDIKLEYAPVLVDESEAIKAALNNRIEIDQAEDAYYESKHLEHLAGLNLRPELNLVVDYTSFSWDEAFTRSWTGKRESKWGIGFVTSGDPWNTREQAAYQMSQFNTQNSGMDLEQVRDNIVLDVKRALREIKRAEDRIHLSEEQIENSKKGYYTSRVKFEYGLANNFDLLQAEKSLRQAQASLISSIIDHRIGEFRFLSVLGLLLEKPMVCR
jgi:outer membrane protein